MMNLPIGPFDIILADPPWRFATRSDKGRGRSPDGGIGAFHYETMSLPEIEALPVPDAAAFDAVLFLWVTDPMLLEGLRVMERWGFLYKTVAFTWAKRKPSGAEHIGTGYYTRSNPEMCLLGTRGRGLKRFDCGVRQLIEAPVREHSRKPDEAHAGIERLFGPDVRRLELFAREMRPGWVSWGSQSDRFNKGEAA